MGKYPIPPKQARRPRPRPRPTPAPNPVIPVDTAEDIKLQLIKEELQDEIVKDAPKIDEESGNWIVNEQDTGVHAQGPQGPQGPQGEQGPQGPQGEGLNEEQVIELLDNMADTDELVINGGVIV